MLHYKSVQKPGKWGGSQKSENYADVIYGRLLRGRGGREEEGDRVDGTNCASQHHAISHARS